LLCLLGITLPFAVVYFMSNLLRIETQLADGQKLSEFLRAREQPAHFTRCLKC
jgi:hypothetical protein